MSSTAHPAELAARTAMGAVTSNDRTAWLAQYDDAAVVFDPVGGSPLDPEGTGLRGRRALEDFWDLMIAPNDVRFTVASVHPAGDEAAVVASVTMKLSTGRAASYDGVFVYAVTPTGQIASVRAYFDVARLLEELTG